MYIIIKGLEVYAYHGVHSEEKEKGQRFILDISCRVDDENACKGDCVEQTVSYSAVSACAVGAFTEHKRDLIEAAADDVATAVMDGFPLISETDVTVKKPDAPVKAQFDYMAVSLHRKRIADEAPVPRKAYLAFGSNIGNGTENIKEAYEALGKAPGIKTVKMSEMYVTAPWGYTEQADFTNACCELETTLSPEALLGVCLGIEAAMGRVRQFKNGPRVIDIDVLMYEGETRNTGELKIPHPGMAQRDFVLRPLLDIAEDGYVLGFNVKRAAEQLEMNEN